LLVAHGFSDLLCMLETSLEEKWRCLFRGQSDKWA